MNVLKSFDNAPVGQRPCVDFANSITLLDCYIYSLEFNATRTLLKRSPTKFIYFKSYHFAALCNNKKTDGRYRKLLEGDNQNSTDLMITPGVASETLSFSYFLLSVS